MRCRLGRSWRCCLSSKPCRLDGLGGRLVVSTVTLTGQTLARKKLAADIGVFYFPLDWRFTVRKSLDTVQTLPGVDCGNRESGPTFFGSAAHVQFRCCWSTAVSPTDP